MIDAKIRNQYVPSIYVKISDSVVTGFFASIFHAKTENMMLSIIPQSATAKKLRKKIKLLADQIFFKKDKIQISKS